MKSGSASGEEEEVQIDCPGFEAKKATTSDLTHILNAALRADFGAIDKDGATAPVKNDNKPELAMFASPVSSKTKKASQHNSPDSVLNGPS
jgi:hypothetical protein